MKEHNSELIQDNHDASPTKEVFLFEVAAEVCFQLGGIYRVIHSKVAEMMSLYGDRYVLIGPFMPTDYTGVFFEFSREEDYQCPVGKAVKALKAEGIDIHFGAWKVNENYPRVVLINPFQAPVNLKEIREDFLNRYNYTLLDNDLMIFIHFGYYIARFFEILSKGLHSNRQVIAHFHEYNTAYGILAIRAKNLDVKTIFTIHATVLGRFLVTFNKSLYSALMNGTADNKKIHNLPVYNDLNFLLEQLATKQCHVFTTVSDTLATEAHAILDRAPDVITRNGLDSVTLTSNTTAGHIADSRKVIEGFLQQYFEISDPDMAATKIVFSSGRYEYENKGFDILIRALASLQKDIKLKNLPLRLICIIISNQPFLPLGRLKITVYQVLDSIRKIIRPKLKAQIPFPVNPLLNYSELSRDLISKGLNNSPADPVKVIYHPEFITPKSPCIKLDYFSFVSACDAGIFPSYYEPWGYTAAESISLGTPTVLSNLSGLAHYLKQIDTSELPSTWLIDRTQGSNKASDELKKILQEITTGLSKKIPANSSVFAWSELIKDYQAAYAMTSKSI